MRPLLLVIMMPAFYLLYTLTLFFIVQKPRCASAWLTFVPLANSFRMRPLTDMSLALAALCLIPFGASVLNRIAWMRLAENANKPGWIESVTQIPFFGVLSSCSPAQVEPPLAGC